MTYETSRTKMKQNMGRELDKGFGITNQDKSKAVAVDHVIDTNKRAIGNGKVNKSEPKFTD